VHEDADPYRPIACSLHDRLEALATLGRVVCVEYRSPGGAVERVDDRVTDIFTRDGAEYLCTAAGREIRLDALMSVGGVAFESGGL
jgi:Rho-binding antiterminator